ncbi:SRPBCC domain-containing protein [Bacillus sp. JJ1566]|uniref:CoxG family protein n=1 Tax=Bacillus sp. JJ1566 TaxID=3122961 RepID=UPI003000A92F
MKIEHSIQLTAGRDVVWDWVTTIERVAECIPGVENMKVIEINKHYSALATDRVGPFKVSFPMELSLEEAEFPLMKIKAWGQDKITKTHVQLELFVEVNENESGGSELHLKVDLQMKGKLATLGQGMVNRKFTEKVEDFAKNLTAVLEGGQQNASAL